MRSLHSMRSQRRGAASLTLSKAARGYMTGLGFAYGLQASRRPHTRPSQPKDEVDAGTCHGSLRPFLAHETETLVWRARPLCTLPNDHAYVISMQPGRAWTHSWAPTAPAPHKVGFRVGVFVQRHVSFSPHTCRAPWSALASCGCTCTPADRLGGVGASTSATPMGPVWVHAR
jgi:hypothetical protein